MHSNNYGTRKAGGASAEAEHDAKSRTGNGVGADEGGSGEGFRHFGREAA
jgi:hypothetical protein